MENEQQKTPSEMAKQIIEAEQLKQSFYILYMNALDKTLKILNDNRESLMLEKSAEAILKKQVDTLLQRIEALNL